MGWLGRKRKPREEEEEEVTPEPLRQLTPVLNILVPDIAGATSFHLRQFYSSNEARAYIKALPSASGLHAFWGLHEPPAGHVSGEGTGESMVLIRSAEGSDTVYVVSFVDLDSANTFARFEAKRGMSLGLLLIYWAELVEIEVGDFGVRLTPQAPPPTPRRAAADPFAGALAAASRPVAEAAPAAPSPVAQTRAVIPEPEAVVETPLEVATPEPEPVVQPAPEVPTPVSESVAETEHEVATPEPEPVAEAELEVVTPVAKVVIEAEAEVETPEPESVVEAELEGVPPVAEPVAEARPEAAPPEPVVEAEPESGTREPGRVFEVRLRTASPEPEPVLEQDVRPEPEPVAREEAEPVLGALPPLFAANAGAGAPSEEEIDIEREAIAFLRASANGKKASPETDDLAPSEAVPIEAAEVLHEEPAAVGNWASTETMAPTTEELADAVGPVRTWESEPDQESADEGECSEDLVQEVEKILKVKRWDKKDSPFRGFDSPPGRF